MEGNVALTGTLKTRKGFVVADRFYVYTKASLLWKAKNFLRAGYIKGLLAKYVGIPVAKTLGLATLFGELRATKYGADGTATDYGVLGYRVVTTAFCEYAVDQLQSESSTWGDFKYHDSGVGGTGEANGDTGIETTDGESRATGTQTEGTSVQYKSVGTISYTSTKAIVEHGLFNDASAGTLMDRTVFSAINVVSGDSIEFTYTITWTAGG